MSNPQYGDPGRHLDWAKRPTLHSCFLCWTRGDGRLGRSYLWWVGQFNSSPVALGRFHMIGGVPWCVEALFGVCEDCRVWVDYNYLSSVGEFFTDQDEAKAHLAMIEVMAS